MPIIWLIFVLIIIIYGYKGFASLFTNKEKSLKWGIIITIIQFIGLFSLFIPYIFFDGELDYWVNMIMGYLKFMFFTWIIGGIIYVFGR